MLSWPSNLPGAPAASSQRHPPSLPTASSSASPLSLFLCPCDKLFLSCLSNTRLCPVRRLHLDPGTLHSCPMAMQAFSLPTSALLHNNPAALCTGCRLVSALPSLRPFPLRADWSTHKLFSYASATTHAAGPSTGELERAGRATQMGCSELALALSP